MLDVHDRGERMVRDYSVVSSLGDEEENGAINIKRV